MQIRSMKVEDIYVVTGLTEITNETAMKLNDEKYCKLLVNGAEYLIFSTYNSNSLWRVGGGGDIYNSNYQEKGVRPVVSLKSDVKASVKDIVSAWNIEI